MTYDFDKITDRKNTFAIKYDEVIARLSTSLTSAMLCLTGAEMLGASAGLGYFVKKFSDYADYTRVLAGIIYIAIIVTILNILVELLQKKVIKWRY